jgi:hypothetical protein
MRRTSIRSAVVLVALCAAAAAFFLGRATSGANARAGQAYGSGYEHGLHIGHDQGVLEGRANQATDVLPSNTRDAAKKAFDDGYRAGANDAFAGYDGGWSFATPYAITLEHGGPGITYRFASRTPIKAGISYRLCPDSSGLCPEPVRK